MKKKLANTSKISHYSRPLLFASILISSSLVSQIDRASAAPALSIENQATATYEDPENPADPNNPNDPKRINATSNTIKVLVQEVAGISIQQKGFTDVNDITTIAKGGDTVYVRFDISNTGNDTTKIFLPNQATLSGTAQVQKVQYFNETNKNWTDVPNSGLTSDSIASQGILKARVVVKINDGASGKISVSLGKTATPDLSNQPETAITPEDVYTIDSPDSTIGEIDGVPANGVREAMATADITINAQAQAFATLKKTAGAYVSADNSITYNLNLKVEDTVPSQAGNFVAADLVGTVVPGLGSTPGILISDAVPIGTQSASVVTPNGWVPVYQYGTAIGATDRADTANWTTTAPNTSNAGTLRRIGFFLSNGRIAKGNSVTGFQFKVTITNPLTTTQVYNIAQLFGNSPANPGDGNDKIPNSNLPVVEESGDNNPNNFNTDGTPGAKDSQGKPVVSPGIVDSSVSTTDPRHPNIIGQDTNGNNTGEGVGGEFVLTTISATNLSILNGPKDHPEAIGIDPITKITDNNHDFTNKSTPVQPGIKTGDKFDPEAIGFFNTVRNGTDFPVDIKVIPTIKADELLPEGTKITLKLSSNDPGVSFTVTGGKVVADDATKSLLVISQVAAKTNVDYITIVDLPANTNALKSYPVELTSFVDLNQDNLPGTDEPKNKTLDRAYTGFIDLLKESRILGSDKKALNEFSPENKIAKPGEYIEYRIKFTNISIGAADGSGSKPLTANNFTITEDGNIAPNNWATLTDNEPGSAKIDLGKLELTPSTDDIKVTKYVNLVGTLTPQSTGTFGFIRKVK